MTKVVEIGIHIYALRIFAVQNLLCRSLVLSRALLWYD